jgi:phosphosulfolactate synthase (CoM biosynthesis protein A)
LAWITENGTNWRKGGVAKIINAIRLQIKMFKAADPEVFA